MSSAPRLSDYHDALTELPNRRRFDDRLEQAQCRVVAERLIATLDMDAAIGVSRELGPRHYRLYAR